MKQTAKRVFTLFMTVCLLVSVFVFNASAAGSTVAFSKSKLTVGESLTVTANFSSGSGNKMYGLMFFVDYNPSVLQYVSSGDGNENEITSGRIKVILSPTGQINVSKQIKFKAKKAGESTIEIKDVEYSNGTEERTLTGASATVKVVSESQKASSDANLKALTISAGTLTPSFSSNVTSYNVTIPYSETEFLVQATKSDSKAKVAVQGSKDMKVGNNKRVVVVTAENGTTKSYTINIIRLDQNGNQVTEDPDPTEENRIEVAIGEEIKYIGEDFSSDIIPAGFKVIDYVYEDKTVAAIGNDEYVMLYLLNPESGNGSFYIIGDDNSFTELVKIEVAGLVYYVLPTDKMPVGFKAVSGCDINGVVVNGFKSTDLAFADFYTVYAIGPQGNVGFYNFDTVEKTMQRYIEADKSLAENEEEPKSETTLLENILAMNLAEKIVAIVVILIILLLIAAIIVLIVKIASSGEKKEKKPKKQKHLEEVDDSQSVGFEYVSVTDPTEKPESEITPKEEKESKE